MDKEGLTLEQIKEIYAGKINDTYTLNLAVAMLENYDELLNKLEEKDKEIERLNNIIDELERFLNYEIYCNFNKEMTKGYQDTLDKLKELKNK